MTIPLVSMAVWTLILLVCGIVHGITGIPLSDFYPFGANEKDFTVHSTDDGNNSLYWSKTFLSLRKIMTSSM